jgi:hypothetical protein
MVNTIYFIIEATPWGNKTRPEMFINKQEAYNFRHELETRLGGIYKIKAV